MKIGIIGLLAEQANFVKDKFPSYAIEFLPREREREAGDFAKRHSKVVLMTKFISHSTQNAVPIHKRVHISGGTTALNNWLSKQASDVTVIHHAPVHKEPAVMASAKDKPTNWAPLKETAMGDTFVVKRPKHTTMTTFESNVNTQRSYYNRKHGIVTTVSFREGVATLTVVDRRSPAKPRGKKAEETPLVDLLANVAKDTGEHADYHREFWQAVFVARACLGYTTDLCERDADDAVAALKKRFA